MIRKLLSRYRAHPLGLWVAVFLFLAAVALLVFVSAPYPVLHQQTSFPATGLPLAGAPAGAQPEKASILLDWPQKIRENDDAFIVLTLAMEEQGSLAVTPGGADPQDIFATYNLMAIGRLDMAGVEAFRGETREPLAPGKETVFRWSIRASQAGTLRGVVWLHLDLVRKDGGGSEQVLLLARPIEIEAASVFGLPANAARLLGWAGIVVSILLGYPFVHDRIRWLSRRREQVSHKRDIVQKIGPE